MRSQWWFLPLSPCMQCLFFSLATFKIYFLLFSAIWLCSALVWVTCAYSTWISWVWIYCFYQIQRILAIISFRCIFLPSQSPGTPITGMRLILGEIATPVIEVLFCFFSSPFQTLCFILDGFYCSVTDLFFYNVRSALKTIQWVYCCIFSALEAPFDPMYM